MPCLFLCKERNNDYLSKESETNYVPIWNKFLLTPKEASAYTNIGINKIDELINNPQCNFVLHIGKKRLVKRIEFEKYLMKQLEV